MVQASTWQPAPGPEDRPGRVAELRGEHPPLPVPGLPPRVREVNVDRVHGFQGSRQVTWVSDISMNKFGFGGDPFRLSFGMNAWLKAIKHANTVPALQ